MSTNYYWAAKMVAGGYIYSDDPVSHICQRHSVGDKKFGLAWAQDPETVKQICRDHADELAVVDEYSRPFLGKDFLAMVEMAASHDVTQIGVWFS